MANTLKQALQIQPGDELVFQGPFDKVVTEELKLTNPTDKQICFKIIQTAPKWYCVRPNSGIIKPNESLTSAIMLQPNDYDETEMKKHKLLVKSMYVPDVETDERGDSLWKEVSPDAVMETKLACRFIQLDNLTYTSSSVSSLMAGDCSRKFERKFLVASIDIGNTCSKHAFSFEHQYNSNPAEIWLSPDLCSTEASTVNPTAVLLDKNEQFDSFGYDALERFEENQQWHIIREIKQPLYKTTNTGSVIYVTDGLGRKTAAVKVISAIIKYIKEHLNTEQERKCPSVRPEDVYWVITVPAVFTVQAISVVKRAALVAGIDVNNVRIVFEPVAALEYCHSMHVYKQHECTYHHRQVLAGSMTDFFSDGKEYMVVDIGEETVDVTVLEKDQMGDVTELYKMCGIGYGGNRVHKALDNLLTTIVGPEAYNRFRTEEYRKFGYKKMHRDFNHKLKDKGPNSMMSIIFALSELLLIDLDEGKCFTDALKVSPYSGEISVIAGKLRLSAALWKALLAEYCLQIVDFMKLVFREKECGQNTCVLLVGGYANFKAIQEAFTRGFPDFDVFIPSDPQYAAVKGAVMLGHKPPSNVERAQVTSDITIKIEDEETNASDFVADDLASGSDFIQSIRQMSLSSDFLGDTIVKTSSKLQAGLTSLKQRMKGKPQEITTSRNDIISDVIAAYGDIDVSRPLLVHFLGEDEGDMTEEMFGFFWEKISGVWFRGENAVIPLVPVAKRAEARRIFPVLGKILEHMLCVLGHFPPQICRSLVLAIAHPDIDVDADIVLEDYLLFLPERESELLTQSLKEKEWSQNRKKRLERFFSVNKISLRPSSMSLKDDLLNIAYAEIIDSSHVYTALIGRGISEFAKKHFFDLIDTASLVAEYRTVHATSENVAQMVEAIFDNPEYSREEKVIINYMSNLISDMNKKELRRFLLWLTGSPNMPRRIEITFNTARSISRTPVACRGRNILELSTAYNSYQDFKRAIMDLLLNEFLTVTEPSQC